MSSAMSSSQGAWYTPPSRDSLGLPALAAPSPFPVGGAVLRRIVAREPVRAASASFSSLVGGRTPMRAVWRREVLGSCRTQAMNRAMDGDTVVIEMLPEAMWSAQQATPSTAVQHAAHNVQRRECSAAAGGRSSRSSRRRAP
jgi:hypothetical protein